MTNEQAIIELRDLISDDRTEKENEALLLAIEKLRDKRPQGEWFFDGGHWRCSACKETPWYDSSPMSCGYKFCPICGAKMKEGGEE